MLEQAQKDGTIDIDAIFGLQGVPGRRLYVYLNQTEPVGDSVGPAFKQKASYFVEHWPDLLFLDHEGYRQCTNTARTTLEDCLLNIHTLWTEGFILPYSRSYAEIRFSSGGAEAIRERPGWAAYRQVWPAITNSTGRAARTSATAPFDISDVDTTTIPDIDCTDFSVDFTSGVGGCISSEWFTQRSMDIGIAGWHQAYDSEGDKHAYVQIKMDDSSDQSTAAIKETLGEFSFFAYDHPDSVTIIPVKYSYEQLWRWVHILKQFEFSSGNTIGLASPHIGENRPRGNIVSYPLESLPEAGQDAVVEYRTTIVVWALKPQEVLDSLPTLLGQLGIPVDAVSVVIHARVEEPTGPGGPEVFGVDLIGWAAGDSGGILPDFAQPVKPVWIMIGGIGALSAVAIAISFLVLRRRRKPSEDTSAQ